MQNDWKPPRAVGGNVFISPDNPETDDDGHQVNADGLYYGRDVHLPTGRILSIGPDAAPLMRVSDGNGGTRPVEIGDRLIFARDMMAECDWSGEVINMLKATTDCPKCGCALLRDAIIGVQD